MLIIIYFSVIASAAEPSYNWTGLYVGFQGIYGSGKTDWRYDISGNKADHNYYGGMAGLFLGFNYKFPVNVVVGAESDLNWGGNYPVPGLAQIRNLLPKQIFLGSGQLVSERDVRFIVFFPMLL